MPERTPTDDFTGPLMASMSNPRGLAAVLDASPDALVVSDSGGTIRFANSHVQGLLGYTPEELVGKTVDSLVPTTMRGHHGGNRSRYLESPVSRRMGARDVLAALHKDGTEIPVEISLGSVELDGDRFVFSAIRDATPRVLTEQRLRQQADALTRSNEALERFAYAASHDLQEPLRMVSSFLQLLERQYGQGLDERAREYVGFAVDGARRMQALIDDLLTYSRVGRGEDTEGPVDLGQITRKVLGDLSLRIQETNGTVNVGDLPVVRGHAGALRQLLQNLIGNGLKFHRPGVPPVVEVSARRAPGWWVVKVSDNGIGLDVRHKDRIFQVFQRLHTRDEFPGTGIGLAICKRAAELHGGTIDVESTPGVGSTFTFTLPERSTE